MPWGAKYWGAEYVKDPTMAELEAHVTDGLDFVAKNPKSAETNMMILSAWNEHDEGHWIAPVWTVCGRYLRLAVPPAASLLSCPQPAKPWLHVFVAPGTREVWRCGET